MNATLSTTTATRTRYVIRMNGTECTATTYTRKANAIERARYYVGVAQESNTDAVVDVVTLKGKIVWTFTVDAPNEYSNTDTTRPIVFTSNDDTVRAEWWFAQGALYLYVRESGAWVLRESHAWRTFTPSYLVWAEIARVVMEISPPEICQYSAMHAFDGVSATEWIDCGVVGTEISACADCAAMYRRLSA